VSRIVLLVIAVLAMIWLLRRSLVDRRPGGKAERQDRPAPELVACAHCGVHLPKYEAIAGGTEDEPVARTYFCSEDHRKLGPA
jgi:uncharacterized protein